MKSRLVNKHIPEEMLAGLQAIYPHLSYIAQTGIVYNNQADASCVPIISGGGSGHEPAHFGYVGAGMLSAAISGPLFVPPKAKYILQAIKQVHKGKGVFVIIKNFEADLKAFQQAIQQARKEGIQVKYVVAHDDISVDTYNFQMRHRGVAGTVLLHKILGAAAQAGASLDELEALALELSVSIHTLGVAFNAVHFPNQVQPSFSLQDDEIMFGIGIHGEAGYRIEKFTSAERIVIELVNKLHRVSKWQEGDHYIALINGMGATPLMEQLVFQHDFMRLMALEGIHIDFIRVGNFMTSYNMAGISITMCPLKNPQWLTYLKANTTAFAW